MFSTFYILQVGPPNIAGPRVTYQLTLTLNEPGCINNVLINALKKINASAALAKSHRTQCSSLSVIASTENKQETEKPSNIVENNTAVATADGNNHYYNYIS